MVKYAPVWTSFLLLRTWTALSIQVSFEETVRADVPQLVYKRGDSSPDWIGSLDDFLPKVRSYAFEVAKTIVGQSHTKTLQCGPLREDLNPNGIFHSRYFVTGLIHVHHRTETRHDSSWKNVLGVRITGTLLHWQNGDDVALKVAQLAGIELDKDMIWAAQGLCDGHTGHAGSGPNHGDCLCAEKGN